MMVNLQRLWLLFSKACPFLACRVIISHLFIHLSLYLSTD
jgi:hypothetical protein